MDAVIMIAVIGFYFMPSVAAHWRKHKSEAAIIVLNVLLGWTVLGWIAALVWALASEGEVVNPDDRPKTKCPECSELVLADARKCKHCGAALVSQGAVPAKGMRACPDCHRPAPVADKYCPACGHNMVVS